MSKTVDQPTANDETSAGPIPTAGVVSAGHNGATNQVSPELESIDYPNQKPASEWMKYLVSAVIIAASIGGFVMLYSLKKPPAERDSQVLVPMVRTVAAEPYAGQLDRVISGTVVPYREIKVAAEVAGNITKKYDSFEAGNFVRKGEKLLEIDPADYKLQYETGKAELQQTQKMLEEAVEEIKGAKRNIELAKSEFELAERDYQRNARIKGALSPSELDQSQRALLAAESALTTRTNTLDMLQAKVERMQASLALSEAQLKRTALNLEKTTIVAPDDGVIVSEMVQEGDFVRAGDPLVTFEDISRSEVICNLTPSDLAWIRDNSTASQQQDQDDRPFSVYEIPKTMVEIYDISEPNIIWQGILERFDGIGRDQSTRTIPCRITIDEPIISSEQGQRALVRGMFVKCRIQVQTSAGNGDQRFLAIPAVALHPGNHVWIVKDKKLARCDVTVVDHVEQLVGEEVRRVVIIDANKSDLRANDAVVATPLAQPTVGADVILESEKLSQDKAKQEKLAQSVQASSEEISENSSAEAGEREAGSVAAVPGNETNRGGAPSEPAKLPEG